MDSADHEILAGCQTCWSTSSVLNKQYILRRIYIN